MCAPDGLMIIGRRGTLENPETTGLFPNPDKGVVALFQSEGAHWAIRAEGWELEPIEASGEDTWPEFAARCRNNIQKIIATKDDGLYAKLYAADVDQLMTMLQAIERSREGAECVSDAWEDYKP